MDEQLIPLYVFLSFLTVIVAIYFLLIRRAIKREKLKVEDREKDYDSIFGEIRKKFGGELEKEESLNPIEPASYLLKGKYKGAGFSLENADIRRLAGYRVEKVYGLQLSLDCPLGFDVNVSYDAVFEYSRYGASIYQLFYKLPSPSGWRHGWFFIKSNSPKEAAGFCDRQKDRLKRISEVGQFHLYGVLSPYSVKIRGGRMSFFFAADAELAGKLIDLAVSIVKAEGQ